jgi:hypothetical protein
MIDSLGKWLAMHWPAHGTWPVQRPQSFTSRSVGAINAEGIMKVILAYKNFAANKNISHIGLGVAAMNTQKELRKAGIAAVVHPITTAAELTQLLQSEQYADATHVNISAPWIPTLEMMKLVNRFQEVQFSMTCHSNVGFLQADANGVQLFRDAMAIQKSTHNFRIAGNCLRFVDWVQASYGAPCAYLPNLYFLHDQVNPSRPIWNSGNLRIGVFGATRPLKNIMSAAGAALELGRNLRADVELWLSSARTEGGGETVLKAVQAMMKGIPFVRVKHAGWQTWPEFTDTVAHMHLLLQPSYTESFNMVTADGIANGVASVAIDWCPPHWQASVDDVLDIARVANNLLHDPRAPLDGLRALRTHNLTGMNAWHMYLCPR